MVKGNLSVTPEFLLLGLSEVPEHQPFLFCLFLTMYLVAVVGNLLIVLANSATSTLHIPMYFLIASLSCVDVCFTSVTVPKMLLNMHAQSQSISYGRCLAQMYFLILFLELDNVLLALMAYDRFLAICHPLHYTTTMSPKFCIMSVSVALIVTNVYPLVHTLLMTIQRLRSSRGKLKAFSTCSSHLAVVSLFYGTLFGVYLRPSSSYTAEDSAATVLAIYPNPDCPVQFYCEWNETQVTGHVLCRAPLSGGVCNYSVSQTFCDGDAAIVRVF
ncbi:olfactory receptor 7G3 [Camelus dromedarius]|uniref:olfactory receptor 7G3 n=1 Tax=Camelus dromedarius TaxID=9838 RepID=UPI003119B94E